MLVLGEIALMTDGSCVRDIGSRFGFAHSCGGYPAYERETVVWRA